MTTKKEPLTEEKDKMFVSLSSLAMDLQRVALAAHRNSKNVADRFLIEAIKRQEEIDPQTLKPYLQKLLIKVGKIEQEKSMEDKAELALLLSTLFQNAALQLKSEKSF